MITATETITLFNQRYDWDGRQEIFFPTVIQGVAYHEAEGQTLAGGSSSTGSAVSERLGVTVRIPLSAKVQDGRQYVDAQTYKEMDDDTAAGYWTLSLNSFFIFGGEMPEKGKTVKGLYRGEVEREYGERLISIEEFADNTRRGSRAVKHWRIGGN